MPQTERHVIAQTRKALRVKQVVEKVGLSKTHLYRMIQRGDFPKSHQLSERIKVWDESDIDLWLAERFSK